MIGGIIYQIPRSVLLPGTTETWLEAFASSPMPALPIPTRAMPRFDPVPPCASWDALDVVLDAEVVGDWWHTFLPGRKMPRDYTQTISSYSQAVFTPQDPPPSPASSTSSWDSGDSSPPSRATSRALPERPGPPTSACGDSIAANPSPRGIRSFESGSSRLSTRPGDSGYVMIVCGEVPWLFADR